METESSTPTAKPLISFDSFEDLRPNVGEEELAEFFGTCLKIDKKDATLSDFTGGVEFTTDVCKNESSSEEDFLVDDDEDDSSEKAEPSDKNEKNVEKSREDCKELILSFEKLRERMIPVRKDKKILKRLIREGSGAAKVPKDAFVLMHYNAFRDNEDEPFDSTFMRSKALRVRLGKGELLVGLEEAIMTMKKSEKSQFLIHYDLAYGEFGCPPRINKCAILMFEVTIEDFMEGKVADLMEDVACEADFDTTLKASEKFHFFGVEYFKKQSYKSAIANFRSALRPLENCEKIKNEDDSKRQQKHLLKLYKNLAICYNCINEPQQACKMCQEALKIDPGSSKALFHYARALISLGDYSEAEKRLLRARNRCPKEDFETINTELLRLLKKKRIAEEKEKDMARNMLNGKSTPRNDAMANKASSSHEESQEFAEDIAKRLDKFVASKKMKKLEIPCDLAPVEVDILRDAAHSRKLCFSKIGGVLDARFLISKAE